jgi:insertion element IS1 protein InsB
MVFVIGDRSTTTCKLLFEKIKYIPTRVYCSDHWRAYEKVIPPDMHYQGKDETYTVESKNSQIRHYLAKFRRRTKCYVKSIENVVMSLKLLIKFKINQ